MFHRLLVEHSLTGVLVYGSMFFAGHEPKHYSRARALQNRMNR